MADGAATLVATMWYTPVRPLGEVWLPLASMVPPSRSTTDHVTRWSDVPCTVAR